MRRPKNLLAVVGKRVFEEFVFYTHIATTETSFLAEQLIELVAFGRVTTEAMDVRIGILKGKRQPYISRNEACVPVVPGFVSEKGLCR